ncbi:hypothetical protein BD410DRAFT_207110 [Rickenella mellea]|uniref:GH16 domain-containing protein n=1 Tax=Rickenella mellea TaxID=50990 RepID=A0A4Y7Q5F8_9AGAM|nr:hypothetical protein BD410DRAFT_207110 [Rickenella mellea]
MHNLALVALAAAFCTSSANAALKLAQNYQGANFFDGWTFQNGIDANTTGNVLYQTREQALQEGLVSVNAAGHAIIKVDNTTDGTQDPTFGRPSVKILSNATVPAGSLVILDAVFMPYGCSVWPAFWMQGPNWPDDGEIDIVENVNLATNNRYALHTLQGCMHPPADQSTGIETGTLMAPDCFNQTNGNEGCLIQDPSPNSFGAGFAANGGGVFALLWDDTGIKIWFFTRSAIPSDVPSNSPNPSGWGTPTAFYPSTTCDTSKFFSPQTIIFDISICGNFAGIPSVFNPSCPGLCTNLVGTPSNYNTAYFEIAYLRVFTNGSSTGSTTQTGSGSGSTPKATGSGSSGNLHRTSTATIFTVLAAIALPLIGGYLSVTL